MKEKGILMVDNDALKRTGIPPEKLAKLWREYEGDPEQFLEENGLKGQFITRDVESAK